MSALHDPVAGRHLSVVDPAPDTLVFPVGRARPGYPAAEIPRFGQDYWQLAALDHRQTAGSVAIRWERFPLPYRASLKRACWVLINVATPAVLHERPGSATKPLLSAKSIDSVGQAWLRFAAWLSGHGVSRLADVDAGLLADYARHLRAQQHSASYYGGQLMALTRLCAYAPFLPPADRLPMPPWDAPGGRYDLLDAGSSSSNENTTPPVHPAVMSPLLVWALRMVTDFAGDILAARAEHRRLEANIPTAGRPGGRADIRHYLDQHLASGQPLPGCSLPGLAWRAKRRTTTLTAPVSLRFIAGTLGVTVQQVSREIERQPRLLDTLGTAPDAPLDLPITGRLDGRAWTDGIDFEAAAALTVHLHTAALVVVAYLSGMRPEEVLHLQRGCCARRGAQRRCCALPGQRPALLRHRRRARQHPPRRRAARTPVDRDRTRRHRHRRARTPRRRRRAVPPRHRPAAHTP